MNKIKKGDNVQVLAGKDLAKTGTVEKVLPKTAQVVVTGVNVFKRHVKKQGEVQGGIIDLTKPIDISNVGLICPNCKKVTRVGFDVSKGEKQRICKRCKKVI